MSNSLNTKGLVTFYASAQTTGGVDTSFAGDFSAVGGTTREIRQGSTTIVLTETGYNTYLEARTAIARGDFVEIR